MHQRTQYTSAGWLHDHPTVSCIEQHEVARMRQAGTLGLSPSFIKRFRSPFLGAEFTNFILYVCDDWQIERERAAARRGLNVNDRGPGWRIRLPVSLKRHGEWEVDSSLSDVDAYGYGVRAGHVWERIGNELVAELTQAVKDTEAEGEAGKGMSIDQIARVAKTMRFDIMLFRDANGNVVMQEPANDGTQVGRASRF